MRIAFTAPMKPLDDPVPSGDRTMGRLIVRGLEQAGHDVRIASRFRSWRASGGLDEQRAVERLARAEAEAIARQWQTEGYRPDLFLTYHLYHKAPDWIGPALADRFVLPYAVIEASRAPKRRAGEWEHGFAAADAALHRADMVAALHRADRECLAAVVPEARLAVFPPFLDERPFVDAPRIQPPADTPPRLLAVGMMREGAKMASYRLLAKALARLDDRPFSLTIAGDGPCRSEAEALFAGHGARFTGALAPEEMPALYATHDILVWPAIREAFGFVFLEAQATGLAIVGGDTFGVPDVVAEGVSGLLAPEGDIDAFAATLARMMNTPGLSARMGTAARAHILSRHGMAAGAGRLDAFVAHALRNHAARATASPR
ncbi:glycosyltransferase family 4 protein [Stappia sp.]|uniref:glycosyltransferase family 4 protein n=1 Tax=Stappia sp. TaxID=1870903 RepID=UPI003A992E2A